MYKILNLTYSSENIGLPTWSPHYTGYLYQAVSFAGSCMPSAGPGASFAYNRFYRALFQLFKVQPGASNLSFLQAELEKAQQSHEELQNMATYMALVNGEKSPLAVNLVKQSAAKMKSVKALVSHNEYTIMNYTTFYTRKPR